MPAVFTNNATSRLASAVVGSSTALALTAGDGAKFPNPAVGTDWFPVTVIKSTGALEVMRCTARNGDTLTVARAQEGTAALSFDVGDRIELRLTAFVIQSILAGIANAQAAADASVKRAGDVMGPMTITGGLDLGTTAVTGYLDLHMAGGNADADARLTVDGGVAGGFANGRLVLTAAKGMLASSFTANELVSAYGGFTTLSNNIITMRCNDSSNASNMHLWFYDYSGAERGLIYASSDGTWHFRSKGGADTMQLLPDRRVALSNTLLIGNAQYAADGNVFGAIWGSDYLSNFLNARFVQRANLPTDIVGYGGTAGGIGTYATMFNRTGANIGPGSTASGTQLTYGSHNDSGSVYASGTWRSMCSGNAGGVGLWQRIG